MRKLSLFLTIGLLAGVTSYADDDKKKPEAIEEPATADAHIRPIDKSGIEARVAFLDTGSAMPGLVVSGIAKGLDPTQKYFSLIYDNGSVAVGPTACEPTSNGSVNGAQMPVGFWNVNKGRNRNLVRHQERTLICKNRHVPHYIDSDRPGTTSCGIQTSGLWCRENRRPGRAEERRGQGRQLTRLVETAASSRTRAHARLCPPRLLVALSSAADAQELGARIEDVK